MIFQAAYSVRPYWRNPSFFSPSFSVRQIPVFHCPVLLFPPLRSCPSFFSPANSSHPSPPVCSSTPSHDRGTHVLLSFSVLLVQYSRARRSPAGASTMSTRLSLPLCYGMRPLSAEIRLSISHIVARLIRVSAALTCLRRGHVDAASSTTPEQ